MSRAWRIGTLRATAAAVAGLLALAPAAAQHTHLTSRGVGVRLAMHGAAPGAPTPAAASSAPPGDAEVAEVLTRDPWRVGTFGTVALARLNLADVQWLADKAAIDGIGSRWNLRHDSRVGVQLGFDPHPNVGLTWQGVVERQRDDQVRLVTDWAYVDWQFAPQWSLHVGRTQSPLYLVSSQRQVGLAHPWIRPPNEVYGLVGNIDSLDGAGLHHEHPFGAATLSVDIHAGRHIDRGAGYSIDHRQFTKVSVAWRDARWTWRAVAARMRTFVRYDALTPLLTTLGDPAAGGDPAAVPDYDFRRLDPVHIVSLGLRHESAPWTVIAEAVHGRTPTRSVPGYASAYVTVGYSVDAWTPYATLSGTRGLDPGEETRLRPGSAAAAVAEGAFLQPAREAGQVTASLGLRWDAQPGLALKVQVDRIEPRRDGRGGTFAAADGSSTLPAGRRSAWLQSAVIEWAY